MISVLYADDEQALRDSVRTFLLRAGGFSVDVVPSVQDALEKLAGTRYDVIVSDYLMPERSGIEFLKALRRTDPSIPFILLTGQGDERVAIDALNHGASAYLRKEELAKTRFAELPHRIREVVEQREMKEAVARSHEALQNQTRALFILNEIISTASRTKDLQDLLRESLDRILVLLNFDAVGIYLADPAAGTATIVQETNFPQEYLDLVRTIPLNRSPYDTLFVKNQPVFTDHFKEISPDLGRKFGFVSLASIPLLSRGRAVGALNVISKQRETITEEEKLTLVSIGMELGGSIERMTAEDNVRRSATNLETLFNSIDEMVFVLSMEGEILEVNTTVLNRLRYTRGDLIGTSVLGVHVPERRDEALRIIQGMIAGTVDACPIPVCTRDGTRIEVETKVTRGTWNGREVLIGVTRDVTERKRAEDALKASENQFRLLLNSTAEAIYGLDLDGNCTFCNPACLRLLGYTRSEELIGRNMHNLIHHTHPDGSPFAVGECRIFQAFRKGDGAHVDDEVFWRADGTPFPAEYWSYPQFHNGRIVGAVVTFLDITERKHGETVQRDLENLLRIILSLSTRFINVSPEDVDREITTCLAEIGAYAATDRCYVFLLSPDGKTMSNPYEWCAPGIAPQKETLQNLPVSMFPWWMQRLQHFETIHIPRVDDLPEEANAEKAILQAQEIKSVLVVPLIIQKHLIGFLGFDNVLREQVWQEKIIALLEVTAKIIANAKARKRADAALKSSREQLALAIEGSGVGLWDWHVQTGETIFNERWAEIIGYTLADLEPVSIQTWLGHAHPDDLKRSGELLQKHFRGETREYECEARMLHRDGHWIWVLDRGKVVERDPAGQPVRMTGTHLDITERKHTEEILAERTALLTNLLDSIPDIVFFKDSGGVYLGCNPRFAEFVGRPRGEIVGHTDYDLFNTEVADVFRTNDLAMMAQNTPRHNEEWIDYPDGRHVLIDTFKAPLRTLDGAVIGLLGISRDITERKRNEQAIFEANRKLNMLNSITRHDVLNQITALGMMLTILGESITDPELLDFVGKAQESTDRITRQIEFTREYQDIGVLSPSWQKVPDLIAASRNLLTSCPFEVRVDTGALEIYADPLLNKVFYNLLENAVRHGETVSTVRFFTQESDAGLLLVYEDNGVGIDERSKKNLFRQGFGKHTGFGLYLMKEILAITGITITETGEPGKGARFEILVPNGEYRFSPGI